MSLPPVLDSLGRPLDQIRLTGLTVRGRHGVFARERRDGQDFVVDVVLHLDTRDAARTDELGRTVDYGGLAGALAEIVAGEPVDLIETLADRLAVRAVADERVVAADVTVHKPGAPIPLSFADVAVTIRRTASWWRTGEALTTAPAHPARVVLALGANLGDRRATLQSAVSALAVEPGVRVVTSSALVETDPVGGPQQPPFLNAVLLVDTVLSPLALLEVCQRVEHQHGRRRLVRWGPRTLDIDIITYSGVSADSERLQLPHPRAGQRAFVLSPWLSVDPQASLPGPAGESVPVAQLLARAADTAGVRPSSEPPLVVPR